jgi:2-oxo-hept-3-ene-1,7-dioate hydratase
MLSQADRRLACELLLAAEAERHPTVQLSNRWPEITVQDSYAIARLVTEFKLTRGAQIRGWKVGLTSKAMQRSSQIDEPDYGVLLDSMFVDDGSKVRRDEYCVPRVELELAFALGTELKGPRLSVLDVLRATEYVVPAIEIIDARVQDPRKIFDTIADNGAAAGVVLGGRPVGPLDVDLRWVAGLMYRNAEIEETGVAAGVLGHPAMAVSWLADKLAEFGASLEPGHIVLSGSFVRPVWANVGDTLRADFGNLGAVSIQFV